MEKYSIILPNERTKTYGYVTLFILLLNFLLLGFIYLNAIEDRRAYLALLGSLISLIFLSLTVLTRFTKKQYPIAAEIPFFILSVIWLMIGKYLLALCIFCFAVIGIYTRRKFVVSFSREGILYPSFPKKMILWSDVSNVVLKDGMLTIDLKNNKLIQSLISKESALINETAFNLFCEENNKPGPSDPQDFIAD